MIIINNSDSYNQKTDYLICKSLARGTRKDYDENRLREVFKEKVKPSDSFDLSLLKLKSYFSDKTIEDDFQKQINEIMFLVFEENINIKIKLPNFLLISEVIAFVKNINNKITNKEHALLYFQLTLFFSLTKIYDSLIIPYYPASSKLFNDLLTDNCSDETFRKRILILKNRTDKINYKHDISYNLRVLEILKANKKDFINKFKVKKFGVYGSFATGKTNEYSDLDLLVVTPDDFSRELKTEVFEYWHFKIDIPIDLVFIREGEIGSTRFNRFKENLKYI